jgi:hypothetical protein
MCNWKRDSKYAIAHFGFPRSSIDGSGSDIFRSNTSKYLLRRISEMKRKMVLVTSLAALVFGLAGAGLAQDIITTTVTTTKCDLATWPLMAGPVTQVGQVAVSNDMNFIYVTYTLSGATPQPVFGNLHMWVGSDALDVPATVSGTPIPNQFCAALGGRCFDATGRTTYQFVIPFADIHMGDAKTSCGLRLYVVTHAEVDMDGIAGGGYLTAFGGNITGPGPEWWVWGKPLICCDFGTPPTPCLKTAFAKGGWVWTTDRKSNPEGLPSLELIKNRWGWAINLTAPTVPGSPATYDIYAGAGLNDINKGIKVGTLEVTWSGTQASVKYTMTAGYKLQEIHIYAGDTSPITTAPGQYGYIDSFDPTGVDSIGPIQFTLSDSNGDGIWLIAHAVVAVPCNK